MRHDESRCPTDRLWLVALTLLLSLAFVAPVFAADEGSNDLPENVLAEDDEGEKFEYEVEDESGLDRSLSELEARVRSTRLLAKVGFEADRRHLRRMIPRAPPIG